MDTAVGAGTLADWVDSLGSNGFLVLPDFCPEELINQLLTVGRQRIEAVQSALGNRTIGIGSAAGFVEIVQRSPGRWDVPIAPETFGTNDRHLPWWPLIERVLGADAEHSFSGVVFSEPGSPAQHWHIDSPHVHAEHRAAHALNVMVALHDIPLAMGPTAVARGSHVLTNHLKNPRLVEKQLVYQHAHTSPDRLIEGTPFPPLEIRAEPVTAGTCLVFDDRILHRGLSNQTPDTRYVAYFSYRQRGYAENTHFESQRSVFDSTDAVAGEEVNE